MISVWLKINNTNETVPKSGQPKSDITSQTSRESALRANH